jgi:SAM-dependent methyltransferase
VPELVARGREGFDVAVGSRYLAKDGLPGWNPYRKTLTQLGHLLTRLLLGMPYDATNAFRYYRLGSLPEPVFDLVGSRGYSFFFESMFVLHVNGFRIGQMAISLPKRTYGSSKMDVREISRSVELLGTTFFKKLFNPEKFELAPPLPADVPRAGEVPADDQGWDDYWEQQKTKAGGLLYDAIASFYRKFIIRRSLNQFVRGYFSRGARVLHAGCGSGQVDVDILGDVEITALDISLGALAFYQKTSRGRARLVHGSIFAIPLPDASMDGVYNLGVMEHFTPEEIGRILAEFRRVLRPGGRVILFWPPEFGLSVLFFKGLKQVFTHVLRRPDVKFHPDEITRVASRRHVTGIMEGAGFRILRYYFGPKDLFTYAVVVAETVHGAPEPVRALRQPAVVGAGQPVPGGGA